MKPRCWLRDVARMRCGWSTSTKCCEIRAPSNSDISKDSGIQKEVKLEVHQLRRPTQGCPTRQKYGRECCKRLRHLWLLGTTGLGQDQMLLITIDKKEAAQSSSLLVLMVWTEHSKPEMFLPIADSG